MGGVVGAWQRAVSRCQSEGMIVRVEPMGQTTASRLLTHDGVTVILLNARHSLADRLAELERHRFALRLAPALRPVL